MRQRRLRTGLLLIGRCRQARARERTRPTESEHGSSSHTVTRPRDFSKPPWPTVSGVAVDDLARCFASVNDPGLRSVGPVVCTGVMNTTPRTVLSIAILSSGLLVSGCASDAGDDAAETAGSTTATPQPEATEDVTRMPVTDDVTRAPLPAETDTATSAPATGEELPWVGQQVLIQTYASTYLAPTVEGGVAVIDDPASSEVPATWTISSVGDGQGYQVATVALTDGQPACLTLVEGGDPTTSSCDPAAVSQIFDVVTLDRPEQVAISSEAGHLGVDTASGTLTVFPSGDQLSSTFTLITE